jgi:hypothetical protein
MQASLKGNQAVDSWDEEKQTDLKNNSLAKFFHDFRRVSQHIGEQIITGGTFSNGKAQYYFEPTKDLLKVPDIEAIEACKHYFIYTLNIVYQCYIDLGHLIDGQQYFTSSQFASIGKTIEDAEEELGLPRGWTDTGDPNCEPYRWETLRGMAGGCEIQEQFHYWLGKVVPWPQKLPEYRRA